MKKFIRALLILLIAPLLTGCGGEDKVYKTEYEIHEVATIDHYEVSYKGFSATKNEMVIKFEIKNNSKTEKQINLKKDFVIYSNESKKIENPYKEEIIKIDSKETKEIHVIVTAKELFDNNGQLLKEVDDYKVLFYSNVVTNNIAFFL